MALLAKATRHSAWILAANVNHSLSHGSLRRLLQEISD
jgi:hypothetical protein